jgi:creatinine amidohydrolase
MLHGYIPPHRFLPYLSWTEITALPDRENTVIVLPCGAIEQHGPHLPCSVDSVIASGVMGKALEKLPADVRAFAMPPITYGKSEEHLHFPGTMTLTGTTLLSTVIEIGESVYRSGFRKLLFANGHGGQPQVLEMAARELRLRHGDFVVVPHGVSRLPNASSKQISEQERKLSMHAGHSETALMLALAPDTVHMERAVANFPPPFPIKLLSADGRPACAWTSRDFGPSGVIGDPTSATREQGLEILDTLSDSWVQALTELYALRWVVRDEPTWGRGHETGFIQPSFTPPAAPATPATA